MNIELFAPAVCASATELKERKEESKFTHVAIKTVCNSPLRLREIGPGGVHEVVQIKNLLTVTELHKIFESPESSTRWLGNDVLFLCAMGGQALYGVLLSVIKVAVDTVDT
jgi:hypothetical protein